MNVTGNEHVVALCGSQQDGSNTRRALDRVLEAAKRVETLGTDLVDDAGVEPDPDTSTACAAPGAE